jgi:hypothetical protein
MADFRFKKLGKLPARLDSRTLKVSNYFAEELPPPPPVKSWLGAVTNWGEFLNDQLGDCTIAGCCHAIQVCSLAAGGEITLPDSDALHYYEKWCGYVNGDPSTDNGGVEINILNNWRKYSFAQHALDGYASANFKDHTEIQQAVTLLGGTYIGLELPLTAQRQDVWDVVPEWTSDAQPGSWGGHCVWVAAYDADTLTCITWGENLQMTWAFWDAYVSEAYALALNIWFEKGPAPSGFNKAALLADLAAL